MRNGWTAMGLIEEYACRAKTEKQKNLLMELETDTYNFLDKHGYLYELTFDWILTRAKKINRNLYKKMYWIEIEPPRKLKIEEIASM